MNLLCRLMDKLNLSKGWTKPRAWPLRWSSSRLFAWHVMLGLLG
jgi:hypothetical protein